MIASLLIAPLVLSAGLLLARSWTLNRLALLMYAILHLSCSFRLYGNPESFLAYFQTDHLHLLFLFVVSILFAGIAIYCQDFLSDETMALKANTYFTVGLLLFVFSLTGATLSSHLGLFWVFMEATTLSSAPLVYFYGTRSTMEATWKYIFICSIGISLAFVGIILLSMGETRNFDSLFFHDLYAHVGQVMPFWLKIAFPFLLIGFGTKMGLAPVHAWLPDAHSEAPSPVSALLSGALLNTAFLGILRVTKLINLAQLGRITSLLFLWVGFLSLFVGAVFLLRNKNYKRMLAYSSIENMGILAIGIGAGGLGVWAAMLHLFAHSLSKASLFLTSGNILKIYQSKHIEDAKGLLEKDPRSGWIWILSFFSLMGFPPFPIFLSKFFILMALWQKGYAILALLFIVLVIVILYGMGRSILVMSLGEIERPVVTQKLPGLVYWPQIIFLLLLFGAGFLPPVLCQLLDQTASAF